MIASPPLFFFFFFHAFIQCLADGELGILVQVHKPTTLALTQDHGYNTLSKHPASHRQLSSKKKSNAKPVVWEVESSPESGDMQTLNGGKAVTSTDFTFTEPGAHKVCVCLYRNQMKNGLMSSEA
jgi:hypothetical protein